MKTIFALCVLGVVGLSVTGCNTCCAPDPCCNPCGPNYVTERYDVAPMHHRAPVHHKHHAVKHHRKPC